VAWSVRPGSIFARRINQQLQKKFHPLRVRTVRPLRHNPILQKVAGQIGILVAGFVGGVRIPPKDRTRIHRNEKVPLELNDRERKLIQWHTFADGTLTDVCALCQSRRTSSLSLYLG